MKSAERKNSLDMESCKGHSDRRELKDIGDKAE